MRAYSIREEDIRDHNENDDAMSMRSGRSGMSGFSVQSVPVFNTLRRVPSRAGSIDIPYSAIHASRPRSPSIIDLFRDALMGPSTPPETVADGMGRSTSPRPSFTQPPGAYRDTSLSAVASADQNGDFMSFVQRMISG